MKLMKNILCMSLLCMGATKAETKIKIAVMEIDGQHTFSSRQDALDYNAKESIKEMQEEYPGMTVDEATNILKGDTIAQNKAFSEYCAKLRDKTQAKVPGVVVADPKLIVYPVGLPVDGADSIFWEEAKGFLDWARAEGMIVYRSADKHPNNSETFARTHKQAPFTTKVITRKGVRADGTVGDVTVVQIVWTTHGRAGKWESEFVNPSPKTFWGKVPVINWFIWGTTDKIREKGQTNEAYSIAFDTYRNDLGFIAELRNDKVDALLTGGVAGGHCVCDSVQDVAESGVQVGVLTSHTRWLSGLGTADKGYRSSLVEKLKKQHATGNVVHYVTVDTATNFKHTQFVTDLFKEANVPLVYVQNKAEARKNLEAKARTKKEAREKEEREKKEKDAQKNAKEQAGQTVAKNPAVLAAAQQATKAKK